MLKYLFKRFIILLITLFIIVTLTFFLMKAMKGSPFNNPKLSLENLLVLKKQYGLDKPEWQQYLLYLKNIVTGDLGVSFQYSNQSVTTLLLQRLGVSIQLGFQALILGIGLGMLAGSFAALHHRTKIDHLLSFVSTLAYSIPSFIIAVFLLNSFGYRLQLLPVSGWGSFLQTILPTIALAIPPFAIISRFVRAEMLETLHSDYILLARAKGLTKHQITNQHVYRNSIIPVLTVIGPMAANLLTGSVLVERIFSIPGIGEQFVNSISSNDYPVIMGTTIVYAIILMVMILLTDIAISLFDPRVRLQQGAYHGR
ncbi:ABC transporter permease [Streptococcus macacae]|uniref:ABC transporter, permease protein n=1 Tax=Streptococcus macacae NCTC 11558 TaxID=764298 RepID=G5JW93_9STRE|nr:ABC transporter permease [Streptococcus macacae]EHJ52813.1 ABC transporter, permease protein [Streptococcus macacae NCTC 11558]SUN77748.1 oligopeptide transport system, permease protein OppB [Streptococcus macacae NCTC 11558]